MSKIEVDAITEQSGSTLTTGGGAGKTVVVDATTVTLGRCGGTVALASGATQSGFGRTGTVDWQTGSIKTSTFTAANGEGYFANTTGGAFTMNLPAGVVGAIVSVQDYNNTFDTHALTVDANGTEKINGGDGGFPVTLDTEGRGVTFVYVDATVGWRSVQDNDFTKAGLNAQFITATGGTITTVCTNFKVHTFTGPGTFTVCTVGNAGGSNTVDYMVIAGGGGGGAFNPSLNNGSGGGAGGYRESPGTVSSYTASPLGASPAVALPVTATGFPITVGAGGGAAPSANNPGNKGSDSVFAGTTTITSTGGGFGNANPSCRVGGPGGSGGGGGGGSFNSAGGTGNSPPVSPPQGNNGGLSCPCSSGPDQGGGGAGGAGAVGQTGSPGTTGGGDGGAGTTSSINATPTTRAGGGGTGNGAGGSGGGGAGGTPSTNGTSGTANTGGGGGGSYANSTAGAGGSGIVIIRYKFQ